MRPLLLHTESVLLHFLKKKISTALLSTIWENTDGCDGQYIYDSTLYLMAVIFQRYSVIIYRYISAPGHGKEVADGLNAIYKRCIYQLMSTFQLPGLKRFDSQM